MELSVHGKQMDVGDALRAHVEEKIEDISSIYFNHTTYATVTFSKEGHGHPQIKAHVSIQAGKDILVTSDSIGNDPYGTFDNAAAKAGKQLRRTKRKVRDDHHAAEQQKEPLADIAAIQDTDED